jgi:hypothetical protein
VFECVEEILNFENLMFIKEKSDATTGSNFITQVTSPPPPPPPKNDNKKRTKLKYNLLQLQIYNRDRSAQLNHKMYINSSKWKSTNIITWNAQIFLFFPHPSNFNVQLLNIYRMVWVFFQIEFNYWPHCFQPSVTYRQLYWLTTVCGATMARIVSTL